MKVLFVIHYPVFGGPHNQARQLHSLLSQCGWETLVLLPTELGNAAQRLTDGGVEVVQMSLHRMRARLSFRIQLSFILGFWSEVLAIRRLLRDRHIDLVMIGGLVNFHAAIAAWWERVPVVWQILDTRTPMMLRKILMPIVKMLADAVMCTGRAVAQAHPGTMELDGRLVNFFPPVDIDDFRPDQERRRRARVRLGVPENGVLLGTVGNVNPQKGHEYLIQAGSIIHRDIPELFIRILGGLTSSHLDYHVRLQEKAESLGIMKDGRFSFVDPGGRVAELLPAFDIFLLTSVPHSEGIPTAILEAMSCGLPVVATDVGSVREVVEDGVTGFVVAPLDSQAIANAILRLVNDEELRRSMGERARVRAVKHFDAKSCADTHVKAFETAIAYHRRNHCTR